MSLFSVKYMLIWWVRGGYEWYNMKIFICNVCLWLVIEICLSLYVIVWV